MSRKILVQEEEGLLLVKEPEGNLQLYGYIMEIEDEEFQNEIMKNKGMNLDQWC